MRNYRHLALLVVLLVQIVGLKLAQAIGPGGDGRRTG